MTHLVLRFKGAPELKAQALESLRQKMPGGLFTPKTSTLVEAQVEDELVPVLRSIGDWDVDLPSYAEISPPAFDWARLRDKLGG